MCGGTEMQGRRPLRIPVACEEFKHQLYNPTCKDFNPATAAAYINPTDYEEFKQSIARSGLLICSPRRHPGAAASSEGVGLAIVAAIQAELDESEKATSLGSGIIKCTAGRPLSPTSAATPAAHISRPIPILLQPQQINSIEENEVPQKSKTSSRGRNCNGQRLNNTGDNLASRQSIFSTASSPPNCNDLSCNGSPSLMLSPDFLRACFFCKRLLVPGKDIYMYRSDRAFCTIECRYQQIVMDERRERRSATACKGDQASTTNNHKHNNRILAAAS